MKVAHLILVHAYPQMLERLVKRLRHPDADIYIQLDQKADIKDFEYLEKTGNLIFLKNRVKTAWGDYSIVEATLLGLKAILNSQTSYSHINLLSGQDYVLRPIKQFHEFLAANPDRSFMHSIDMTGVEWPDGKERLIKYSLGDYKLPGKFFLQKLANRIMPPRKLPSPLKPYGRSQWVTITPECAQYTIDYIEQHPKVKRFFRMTWAVDELVFQTILVNSPLKEKLVNNNLRHIEQLGEHRPIIFTKADAPKLIASGCFFARKFDDGVDTDIYDLLDAQIGYVEEIL